MAQKNLVNWEKGKELKVPDEVADALEEGRLIENRQDGKRSYYHVYSIDQSPAMENHAMFLVLSPEELMIQAEDEAAAWREAVGISAGI